MYFYFSVERVVVWVRPRYPCRAASVTLRHRVWDEWSQHLSIHSVWVSVELVEDTSCCCVHCWTMNHWDQVTAWLISSDHDSDQSELRSRPIRVKMMTNQGYDSDQSELWPRPFKIHVQFMYSEYFRFWPIKVWYRPISPTIWDQSK